MTQAGSVIYQILGVALNDEHGKLRCPKDVLDHVHINFNLRALTHFLHLRQLIRILAVLA